MSDLRHMIHRQLFELTACTGQPAWEWDRTSADLHRDLLLPVLEACFREADRSGEHLVIDRLEIDLGVFGGKDVFRKEAGDRLRERLSVELRVKRQEASGRGELTSTGKSSYSPANPADAGTALHGSTSVEKTAGKDSRHVLPPELMDGQEARFAAFLFFLKAGRLPWWSGDQGKDVFGKAFQDTLTGPYIRRIIKVMEEGKPVEGKTAGAGDFPVSAESIRCVRTLDDAVLLRMAVEKRWNVNELQREWEMLRSCALAFPACFPVIRQWYWTTILGLKSAGDLTMAHWEHIFPRGETPEQLYTQLQERMWGSKRPSLHYFIESRIRAGLQGNASATPSAIPGENTAPSGITPESTKTPAPGEITSPENITPEPEGLYVEAAGLVLLHPFLSELFAATGCREGKAWAPYGQQTAVRLLGYLSDNDADLPEYRLVFHKVLAGMAPEEPLEAIAPVTAAMTDACNELLDAVLGHWSALKNTGRDGLREGFLQRPGILRSGSEGMQLEMEKRAQDVLINRLPWSCSLVRLSWMEQLVAVNWI